jgi:hypothetical protein
MRVAILTFHYMHNYGAVYQALGLQTALQKLGCETEFINYRPEYIKTMTSLRRGWGVRSGFIRSLGIKAPLFVFKEIFNRVTESRWRLIFDTFRDDNLIISDPISKRSHLSEYTGKFDAVVVGSDQVWNLNWQRDFDDTYFLGFLKDSPRTPKKIAYAPCFGQSSQPNTLLRDAIPFIKKFDCIGMRNKFGIHIVKEQAHKPTQYVVDPAFFVTSMPPPTPESQYLLLYIVDSGLTQHTANIALRISNKLNLPIFQVHAGPKTSVKDKRIAEIPKCTPSEWFQKIGQATFVCSESFHGVLYAIANNVPFIATSKPNRSERVTDLITRYSNSDRFITTSDPLSLNLEAPHFIKTDNLSKDITDSMLFLKNALFE